MILEKNHNKKSLGGEIKMDIVYIEAFGIVAQWVALYLSGRVMNLFKMSMFQIFDHWENPSVVLSRAIFLHFLFGVLDGTYWQGAWSADYTGHWARDWLFENGIIANIPFRHLGPSVVAYMHLYARALQEKSDMFKYHVEITVVTLLAIAHTMTLTPGN